MPELMTTKQEHRANLERLYPDLIRHGGLAEALRAALANTGSSLTVSEYSKTTSVLVSARIGMERRFSQIYVALHERLFVFDFWNRGVMLATGRTADLCAMVRAINRWVASDCSTSDLATEFDGINVQPDAPSYERGEEVEHRWREYLASLPEHFPELQAFVIAAAAHPKLRQLFPVTSLHRFGFSRCTGYPFTRDIPHVRPRGVNEYEIIAPGGATLGWGSAEDAVKLIVSALPPNCGPAVPGTAEDLDNA